MKKGWSLDNKLTIWIIIPIGVLTLVAALLVVPEVRKWFHLHDQAATENSQTDGKSQQNVAQPVPSSRTVELTKVEPPKTIRKATQRITTHIVGNTNVSDNNISGDNNVIGNNNQKGSVAVAPYGIAITGGTVNNPTVNNNISVLPDLAMSGAQEMQVAAALDNYFADVSVLLTIVQPSKQTLQFTEALNRILTNAGANVRVIRVWGMYVPPDGIILYKGMSIISFPSNLRDSVGKLANALGAANVVSVVPIFDRDDNKIEIVINRSMERREDVR